MARRGNSKKRGKAEPASWQIDAAGVLKVVFYLVLLAGSTLWFPENFFDGFETPKLFAVELISCLALAGWAGWLLVGRRDAVDASLPRPALPLVALFVLGVVSITWSLNPWLAAERMLHYSVLAGAMFYAWYLYRGKKIRNLLLFVAAVGSVLAGWGLLLDAVEPLRELVYPHFKEVWGGGKVIDNYRPLTSNQGNPNFLFHLLVLTVPLTLGALIESLTRRRAGLPAAILLGGGLLLQLACFTYAANRSGLVATAGATALFFLLLVLFRRRTIVITAKQYWKHALLALVLLILAGGVYVRFTDTGSRWGGKAATVLSGGWQNWQRRFASLRSTENIDVYSRVVFLETDAAMVADDPLLGKGVGQFVTEFPRYKTARHWEKFSLRPPDITMWSLIPEQAHNEYLQVLVELGGLGFVLFAAFWIMLGWSTLKSLRDPSENRTFYLILGAAAGLAGVLANSMLTFPLQTVTSGLMVWTTAGLLMASCCGGDGACGVVEIKIATRKAIVKTILIVLLLLAVLGSWGAVRILRAENKFSMALRQHALDLGFSLRTNGEAAEMLPYRFEMQFVQGWLGFLAHDTTTARIYFERSIDAAPYFPPPYRHLAEYCFRQGDYKCAEQYMVRYGELYPPGIDGNYHTMIGLISLSDSTRDRFGEASYHLQAAGSLQVGLILAEKFLWERRQPDSTLAVLQPHRERISRRHGEYARTYFLSAAAELARGDSAAALARLDTLLNVRVQPEGRYADDARQLRQRLQNQ